MKNGVDYTMNDAGMAGPRLRCFLRAGMLVVLVMGATGATAAHAANCPELPEMKLSHLQGTVVGPSGVAVPQITIQALRDGIVLATTQTDGKGRFAFTAAQGNYVLHVQFLESKSLDLRVRVVHKVEFFRSARIRAVLGLSGTRCSYATTSAKQFKNEMRRYKTRLGEVQGGP